MGTHVVLVRGINVGGTGILPMKDLTALCSGLGFQQVRTYIQSGNVICESNLSEEKARSCLEKALSARMGKPIGVMVRTPAEMRSILGKNPFPDKEPQKVAVFFLNTIPPKDLKKNLAAPGGEQVLTGKREIYVYYPDGMGRSKLKLPLERAAATVRNLKTVARLVEMTKD